jgi:D-inositol-3-phosphate glycosyltransferase
MRIAMVSEHASPLAASSGLGGVDAGGQNVAVRALALALADAGHEVVVHTRRTDPVTPRRVPLTGSGRAPGSVVVDHVDAGPACELAKDDLVDHMDAFSDELAACWRSDVSERPDVVHAHFWMSGMAALPAARALGVPIVQTFHALGSVKRRHQGAEDTSPARRVAVESDLGASVDRVLATCREEVDELLALGVAADQATVVPCGVDVEHFRPDGPAVPAAARGDRFRVLTVSRLVPRKGVDTVIGALARLPDDVELVVAGGPPAAGLDDDPEVARLRARARAEGVADRVTFLGAVGQDALPALYRSADAVACVPVYEPFGLVPLEAMACGKPVVAAAVGGLADTVVDGVTGHHVPAGDPAAVAAALDALRRDPARARAQGRAGRRRAVAEYGWDRVAAAHERVYAEVAAAATGPSAAPRVGVLASGSPA